MISKRLADILDFMNLKKEKESPVNVIWSYESAPGEDYKSVWKGGISYYVHLGRGVTTYYLEEDVIFRLEQEMSRKEKQ